MAIKRKFGGIGAKGSAKMKFFHPSAHLREKYGKGHVNQERFNDLTITGQCQQVFSQRFKSECVGCNVTHQDFPSVTFQIAKNNFHVKLEGERILISKKATEVPQENVVPSLLANEGSPNNQSIHLSRSNLSSLINRWLISTIHSQ